MSYFKVYGPTTAPVDRSGVLKFPVRMRSMFPLPQQNGSFTKTYEELCNERAQQLLARAERLDTQLYAFWSGGIDSTCLLISLLKNASPSQRERLVVLMSEESIAEYPLFYRKYIRGQLRRESAMLFPYIIGTPVLLVNGECNDQLFGSDIIETAINRFGTDAVCKPYDRNLFASFFTQGIGGEGMGSDTPFYVELFEHLCDNAPVTLSSNYDHFWWINFVLKWQTVYMRMLNYTAERNAHLLTETYLRKYYAPFYNTEGFQLWSMENTDQRLTNGWRSYKWPAKDVIYNFTKDANYRDIKVKRGSLKFLIMSQVSSNFIDDKFGFHNEVAIEDFYAKDNVFV
jgi:hypothetical protein